MQRQLMQQLTAEIREVERNFSALPIAPLITELKQRHPQDHVQRYLDAVQEHMLAHLEWVQRRRSTGPGRGAALAAAAQST